MLICKGTVSWVGRKIGGVRSVVGAVGRPGVGSVTICSPVNKSLKRPSENYLKYLSTSFFTALSDEILLEPVEQNGAIWGEIGDSGQTMSIFKAGGFVGEFHHNVDDKGRPHDSVLLGARRSNSGGESVSRPAQSGRLRDGVSPEDGSGSWRSASPRSAWATRRASVR